MTSHAPRLPAAARALGRRAWRPVAIVAVVAALSLAARSADESGAPTASAGGTASFFVETVVSGLNIPTDFAYAPDGRIFVSQNDGTVAIYKEGALLSEPFITLPVAVGGERGIGGIALDPDFDTNGYVYIYYTHMENAAEPLGPQTARLLRVTADGDVAESGSEVVLLGTETGGPTMPSCEDLAPGADCLPADGTAHFSGDINFASDGTLFLSTGDASFGTPNLPQLAYRSQKLDSLAGKLLRIDPADGTAPADNPLYTGDPTENESKVYAYGLRQPYRVAFKPGTDTPVLADVSGHTWEEVNVILPGVNYGWPCYEGVWQFMTQLSGCQALYSSGDPVQHPVHAYLRGGGAAAIGGVFYDGTSNYPAEYEGAYFYADWVQRWIAVLELDEENNLVPGSDQIVLEDAAAITSFQIGPDGDICFTTFTYNEPVDPGALRCLRYSAGNQAPTAKASATPQGGLEPLEVELSSAGSSDPEGQPLTYEWDFGDTNTSSEANPTHIYTSPGTYVVELTVTDAELAQDQDSVTVVAGNEPPVATITMPDDRDSYEAGERIDYRGEGADAEDGDLPNSSLSWTILLHHCIPTTATCHTHPFIVATGAGTRVTAPDQDEEILYLEFILKVTDSAGLTDAQSIKLGPDTDGDGLLDFDELLAHGTNYLDPNGDGDACLDGHELGANEMFGGRRDPANGWDFYDTGGDLAVGLFDDLFPVAMAFGLTTSDPGYDPALDRSAPPLPSEEPDPTKREPWDMGPPDGDIDLFTDVFGVAAQYGHDCSNPP